MAKLKILKTGETDIESTDIWRFAMHSDYPTFKIATQGTKNVVIPAGEYAVSVDMEDVVHNLGYSPFVFASIGYGDNSMPVNGVTVFFDGIIKDMDGYDAEIFVNTSITNNVFKLWVLAPWGVNQSTTMVVNYMIALNEF